MGRSCWTTASLARGKTHAGAAVHRISSARGHHGRRPMKKWIKRALIALVLVVLAAVIAGWWLMRGSLPALEGELALPGLSAPVTIQRDANGVVTVDAANENDAMRALGYVHAQERYFEMDLLRRTSAGELSAL